MITNTEPIINYIRPNSGYGHYNDIFDQYYDSAEEYILTKDPSLINNDDQRISKSNDIAYEQTVEYLKSININLVEDFPEHLRKEE